MRRFDKKNNIRKANLLAEQRYLTNKGFINEGISAGLADDNESQIQSWITEYNGDFNAVAKKLINTILEIKIGSTFDRLDKQFTYTYSDVFGDGVESVSELLKANLIDGAIKKANDVTNTISRYSESSQKYGETYRVEVIGALPHKDGGYKYRWVYGIVAHTPEEAEIKAENEFKKTHKYSDISFFSAKTIENPTEDDMRFKPGERIN